MFSREPEFSGNGLADTIRKVRRRIMVNRWLQQWITRATGSLARRPPGATPPLLRAPLVAGGIAIALAAAVAAVRVRYSRPSAYERLSGSTTKAARVIASRQPSISGAPPIQARCSCGNAKHGGRVAKLDPERFSPIRMPAKMQWTAGLVSDLWGLCAFHASDGPPLPALRANRPNRGPSRPHCRFRGFLTALNPRPRRARRPKRRHGSQRG